jgi:hypothetical protein
MFQPKQNRNVNLGCRRKWRGGFRVDCTRTACDGSLPFQTPRNRSPSAAGPRPWPVISHAYYTHVLQHANHALPANHYVRALGVRLSVYQVLLFMCTYLVCYLSTCCRVAAPLAGAVTATPAVAAPAVVAATLAPASAAVVVAAGAAGPALSWLVASTVVLRAAGYR